MMVATKGISNRHRIIAVVLLLVTLGGIYWFVDATVIAKYQAYQAEMDSLYDRLQVLNRMLATRESLEKKLQQIKQDKSINVYFLKQSSPTLAASELQQRVKNIVEASGGDLISSQILPVISEEGFSRVAIRISMNGDVKAIQEVLYELESKSPLVFVDDLQITARTIRQRRRRRTNRIAQPTTNVQLTTQFELAGYMRGSEG